MTDNILNIFAEEVQDVGLVAKTSDGGDAEGLGLDADLAPVAKPKKRGRPKKIRGILACCWQSQLL